MADGTKIEWTEATWNPITGCSVVSPGCTNCYAMKLAGGRLRSHPSRKGLTRPSKAGPVWTGEVRFNADWLDQPLRWCRPRMVFVCAHGDLFHEDVPDEWIDKVFAVMALAPQHTFQVLTKRAARMREYLSEGRPHWIARRILDLAIERAVRVSDKWPVKSLGSDIDAPDDVTLHSWPLPNVWLGVSVEDQARADERIPDLLNTPAAVRWISAEPLLGLVDLSGFLPRPPGAKWAPGVECRHGYDACPICDGDPNPALDWVVVGGESGPGARPMHPDWARSLRDQCEDVGVPYFFKQWGDWLPAGDWYADHPVSLVLREWNGNAWGEVNPNGSAEYMARIGKKAAGRELDGRTWDEMPAGRMTAGVR